MMEVMWREEPCSKKDRSQSGLRIRARSGRARRAGNHKPFSIWPQPSSRICNRDVKRGIDETERTHWSTGWIWYNDGLLDIVSSSSRSITNRVG